MEFNREIIEKEQIKKLKEEDVILILNPGRQGDIYGCTFVIKEENYYKMYYVKDFMAVHEEMFEVFPNFRKAWDEEENAKFNYIYMGFGNGLSVSKDIYEEFCDYLDIELRNHEQFELGEGYYGSIKYRTWKNALKKMLDNKGIELK